MRETPDNDIRVFEFFREGRHISMGGQATEWNQADLEQICQNYASQPPAPLVLGHPVENGPGLGEVKKVFQKNGALYAMARCSKELINLVRSGAYKHVSASFLPAFPPLSGWKLRHIGFLGSMAPAVKGLAALQFGEASDILSFAAGEASLLQIGGPSPAFSAPHGWRVDPQRLRLHELALRYQAGYPELSYIEAASMAETLIYS